MSKNYLDWSPDTGYLLQYFAEMIRSVISERTDTGLGVGRAAFAPYKEKYAIEGLNPKAVAEDPETGKDKWAEGTEVPRDARGRFSKRLVRGPGDLVALRGPEKDTAPGRHMRDNLRVFPRNIRENTTTAKVRLSGSRKDGSGKSFTHEARAKTVQFGITPPQGGNNPVRPWVGITDAEWHKIVQEASRDAALAFIVKKKEQVQTEQQQKARRKAERFAKKQLAQEKRAARQARGRAGGAGVR